MERRQRTRLATLVILALVFGTGALVGIATDRAVGPRDAVAEDVERGERGRREGRRGERWQPMYAQVGLSEASLEKADSIVRRHRQELGERFDAYRDSVNELVEQSGLEREFRTSRDSLVTELREDIRVLMTAEQVVRYDSLLAANDQQRRRGRSRDQSPDDDRRK